MFVKSPVEVKTWFPVLTWDTLVDLLCRDWSSLINRQVLRGSLLFASRFSEKYLRLAFFTELLALFLASLNCFQIEGSFVDAAFFFRKSLLCISRNSSLVIQGDRLFLTLFVLNGACLSITLAKFPQRKRVNVVSFTWKCQKIQFFFILAGCSFIFARPVALLVVTVYWAFHCWYIAFISTEIF